MAGKPRFILCNCTGENPGLRSIDFCQVLNYIHNELESEYAVLHPELCVDDGERFLLQVLKPGERYVIGACDPRMQKKMLRDVFKKAGLRFEEAAIPLDLRTLTTDQAIEKVKQAFARAQAPGGAASAPTARRTTRSANPDSGR